MNQPVYDSAVSPPVKKTGDSPVPSESADVMESPRHGEMLRRAESEEREKRKQRELERLGRLAEFD